MGSHLGLVGICAALVVPLTETFMEASAGQTLSVAVVAYNQAGVAIDTLARAKLDVARIYGDGSIGVIWMNPAAPEPAGNFVIRLLIRPRPVNASESVMGIAIGDADEISGSAFVFYDRVLRTALEQRQDVARVLAYAMAHEMGHILLPYPAHSPLGIMRAAWDGDDLRDIASGSLAFTAAQQAAIRVKASTCCRNDLLYLDAIHRGVESSAPCIARSPIHCDEAHDTSSRTSASWRR